MLTRILAATCAVVTLSAGALLVRVAVDVNSINTLTSQVAALTPRVTAGDACLSQAQQRRATAAGLVKAANDMQQAGRGL
jgi:hypothetical protein